jgi:hypothetical protein
MSHDPITRTFMTAATAYLCAGKPTAELTHALVDAVMRLIAARSGVKVRMIVGDGVITRGGE